MPPPKPQDQGQQAPRSAAEQMNEMRGQQAREAEAQPTDPKEEENVPAGGERTLTARTLVDDINAEFERRVTANDPEGNGAVLAAMYRAIAPTAGPVIQDVLLRRLGIAEE